MKVNNLTFRRFLVSPGIKMPKFEVQPQTSMKKPAPGASSSIKNGAAGQKLFPRGTFLRTLNHELPSFFGWAVAFSGIMLAWPWVAKTSSNLIHSVPSQNPQVGFEGGKIFVNIPTKEVHLDKVSSE